MLVVYAGGCVSSQRIREMKENVSAANKRLAEAELNCRRGEPLRPGAATPAAMLIVK